MTQVPVKTSIIESSCRAGLDAIASTRLADKIVQVDALMHDEQSFFEKVLGHKPNILTREDAEKELMMYAEKKDYLPVGEFIWVHYNKDEEARLALLLDSCHLAAEEVIWLGLEDVALVNRYLKKV